MKKDAIICPQGKYRYYLTRQWDLYLPSVNFIGLNPSTADASDDDPTIRKCMTYARGWGYGGIIMTNLFAFRTKDPYEMMQQGVNAIGAENNRYLIQGHKEAKISVAAWGNHGGLNERSKDVVHLIPNLYCLKITKLKQPAHPLYLSSQLTPVKFEFSE